MLKILCTGSSGLVGTAFMEIMQAHKLKYNVIGLTSKDCDLRNYEKTLEKFKEIKPDYVIHLASCVGGLFKNMNKKISMFEDNLLINYNVINISHKIGVKKLISCLSTCIFPDKTTYPINESMLFNGPPHDSNDAYAYAKRTIEIHSKIYRETYGDDFICVIPTNIYGPHDNFNLEDAHVIPALIHKCYLAKLDNKKFIIAGSGRPLRQFIHSKDVGKLIFWCLENYKQSEPIILSVDEKDEVSIEQIGRFIAKEFSYEHMIEFDITKPDGQYKKTADNKKLKDLNAEYEFIKLADGLSDTVKWFIENYDNSRK